MAFRRRDIVFTLILTTILISSGSSTSIPLLSSITSRIKRPFFFHDSRLPLNNHNFNVLDKSDSDTDDQFIPFSARQVEPSAEPTSTPTVSVTPSAPAPSPASGTPSSSPTGGSGSAPSASPSSSSASGVPGASPSASVSPSASSVPAGSSAGPSASPSSSAVGGGTGSTPSASPSVSALVVGGSSPSASPSVSPVNPGGGAFCQRVVPFRDGVLAKIDVARFRQTYTFRNNLVKFNYKFTPSGTSFKVRVRALGNRRIARVAINFFYPPIKLNNKRKLGPITRFDFNDPANRGFKRDFDLSNYRVLPGRTSCCDTEGQVGVFIKTCNPSQKKRVRCGFKLLSVTVPIRCTRA